MRDIVIRLTETEAALLLLMAEKTKPVIEADEDEARKQGILPVANATIAKLRKPLKRRGII